MDGSLTLTTYVDDTGVDEGIKEIEDKGSKATNVFAKILSKISKHSSGAIRSIARIGSKIVKLIGAIGGIGLALGGIIAIIGVLGSAIAKATQTEEVKADLAYIKFALDQAIKPLVDAIAKIIIKIIGWVVKLLGFINAISIALFNHDMFTEATVENFKKTNKQAKDLKKTLAGFDEMNVLSDNSGSDSSAGIGDLSKDFPNLQEETKKSTQLLEKLKDMALNTGKEMREALANPEMFNKAYGYWDLFMYGITEIFSGIWDYIEGWAKQFVGIGEMVYGLFTGNFELIKLGFKDFIEGIKLKINGFVKFFEGIFNTIIGFIRGILSPIIKWIDTTIITPIVNKFNGLKEKISKPFKDGVENIKKEFKKLPSWLQTTIKGMLNSVISMLNILIAGINQILTPLRAAIVVVGKVMGKNWSLQTIKIPKIPKLAKGGIINLPNRGVGIGGAIGGESGREGVIPLTDSQQMALLGEAIGKYITINANITNSMNGRVLSREIQKIQNQSNFAMNR